MTTKTTKTTPKVDVTAAPVPVTVPAAASLNASADPAPTTPAPLPDVPPPFAPAVPKAKRQMDLTVRAPDGRILFRHDELDDKGAYEGQGVIPRAVLDDLRELRLAADHAMNPTSVCRSRRRNQQIKGAPNSFHIWDEPHVGAPGCIAFDIAWDKWDDAKRIRFAELAWRMGWSLGLHATFIHIDRRHRYGFGQVWGVYTAKPSQAVIDHVHRISARPGGKW